MTRVFVFTVLALLATGVTSFAQDKPRPNILWLTCEDMGPHLGCFGDTYATTPNVDKLAARGLRYTRVWSCAPVCAPARTTLITGMYPPSIGAEHMRSLVALPEDMKLYPQSLREAGYYCTNNVKEDYNVEKPAKTWDESSNKAHWRNRPDGQPFFAVFNTTVTHESQIRTRPHKAVHDPAGVRVPAYHPDTPEVRQDWAQYYDNITEMDAHVGARLKELEDAGLAADTIVFFYSDHGSGMPRNKRFPGNSGLRVPLIVLIPEKFQSLRPDDYKPGGETQRLASFVDFAPTVLSLAGIQPPGHFQGQAFLGPFGKLPPPFVFGFRARMDERLDLSRSVSDGRYVYIRNYMPHKPWGQHVSYMYETPTTRVWKRLYDEGRLTPERARFFQVKQPEEFYDLQNDPDEVHNLAGAQEHARKFAELRQAHADWEARIRDVSFLPEDEMHTRAEGATVYEMGHDDEKYPFARVYSTANLGSHPSLENTAELAKRLKDSDSAVRYWAALGLRIHGQAAVRANAAPLRAALTDVAPSVRVAAAEALGLFGERADHLKAVEVLIELAPLVKNGPYVPVQALNALDDLDSQDPTILPRLAEATAGELAIPQRVRNYVPRLIEKLRQDAMK